MSWGERSCKHKPCIVPDKQTMLSCNVDCESYVWDGKTSPDSTPRKTLLFNDAINEELIRAQEQHGGFNSLHEAIAVLREEYLELEREIFLKKPNMDNVIAECVQVGAMAKKLYLFTLKLKLEQK